MLRMFRSGLSLFLLFTLLTGFAYPLAVTGLAQLLLPWRANGSVLAVGGTPAGSALIGQPFSDPKYFWGRPSATAPQPYNGLASGGSNLGPTNPAQLAAVKGNVDALRAADPGNTAPVPVDLVTASASGLDPDISLAAALYQRDRVARARHLAPARVQQLIDDHARQPLFGVFGEPTVNVLELNLALDGVAPEAVD